MVRNVWVVVVMGGGGLEEKERIALRVMGTGRSKKDGS
jgi:hypothetical protein